MPRYEYKVVPAPTRGEKAKGVKTPEGRFAQSVQSLLNRMGADGWEYQRAELLPSEERSGLTGSATKWRNVLVFRRALDADLESFQPVVLDVEEPQSPANEAEPREATGAEVMLKDNGVEEFSEVSGMTTALKERAAQHATGEPDEEDKKT